MTLQGPAGIQHIISPELPIDCVSFRNPDGRAALAAVVALCRTMGPVVVLDAGALDVVIVVQPADDPNALAARWPW